MQREETKRTMIMQCLTEVQRHAEFQAPMFVTEATRFDITTAIPIELEATSY
jgi:hypothetical protein